MATKYDPEILQVFADRLYRQADWLAFRYAASGFVLGWVGSAIIFSAIYRAGRSPAGVEGGATFVAIIVALLGLAHGHGKAFNLRLEAQRTLCQM
jgi:hypothetical protein